MSVNMYTTSISKINNWAVSFYAITFIFSAKLTSTKSSVLQNTYGSSIQIHTHCHEQSGCPHNEIYEFL